MQLRRNVLSGGSSGIAIRAPGTFDEKWTLYNADVLTEYTSRVIKLLSGGDYTLDDGLEIQINGTWIIGNEGTLAAGDSIRVRMASAEAYAVTVAKVVNIGGVDCTFSVTTMDEVYAGFPYTFPFILE